MWWKKNYRFDGHIAKSIGVSEDYHSVKTTQFPYSLSCTIHLLTTPVTGVAATQIWVQAEVHSMPVSVSR
jgi:hypothetical protein